MLVTSLMASTATAISYRTRFHAEPPGFLMPSIGEIIRELTLGLDFGGKLLGEE